jgi:hypothetical protein
MIGISISLYDKFDDLSVLLEIIRENWDDEYFISVCSNHPNAETRLAELDCDVDYFEQGANIAYDSSMSEFRGDANLKYRVYNTIRTACRGALAGDNVSHVMHLHADAWPLCEETIKSLIDEMSDRNAAVTYKTRPGVFQDRYTPGHLSDQFIIYDADAANAVNLFEREALDFPPGYVIHQILSMICLVKLGWQGMYNYSTRIEEEHWDGKSISEVRNPARPMLYNPEYKQVHIATEDFADDLGKSLQAHYLQKHDVTNGKNIKELINSYGMPEDVLFRQIESYFDSLDDELRWYGLSVESFGRNVNHIDSFLQASPLEKFKTIGEILLNTASKVVLRNDEAIRNQPVEKVYADKLDGTDYPDEFSDLIFDNK